MGKIHQLYIKYHDSLPDDTNTNTNPDEIEKNKKNFEDALNDVTDFFERDDDNHTLLFYATYAGDKKLVKYILEKIDRFDKNGVTFVEELEYAIARLDKPLIKLFLGHGADINQKYQESGATQLQIAIGIGDVEEVRLLLALGANLAAYNELADESLVKTIFRSNKSDLLAKIEILNLISLWCWAKNIKIDFSNVTVTPGVFNNIFLFDGIIEGEPITKDTTGFDKALFNISALTNAFTTHFKYYEDIYLATKYRIEHGDSNPDLLEFTKTIKRFWQKQEMHKGLKEGYIFYCADHMSFYNSHEKKGKIPKEVDERVIELAAELEIKFPSENVTTNQKK